VTFLLNQFLSVSHNTHDQVNSKDMPRFRCFVRRGGPVFRKQLPCKRPDQNEKRKYTFDQEEAVTKKEKVDLEDGHNPDLKPPVEEVMEKRRTIEEIEESTADDIEKYPVYFRCAYCSKNFKDLNSLRESLYPKQATTRLTRSNTTRFEIACNVRVIEEKIPKFVPENYAPPKRNPWVIVIDRKTRKPQPQEEWDDSTKEQMEKYT